MKFRKITNVFPEKTDDINRWLPPPPTKFALVANDYIDDKEGFRAVCLTHRNEMLILLQYIEDLMRKHYEKNDKAENVLKKIWNYVYDEQKELFADYRD